MSYNLFVAPTTNIFGPHLCFAVNNVMVLTPSVYENVDESHWVPLIATPPPPSPFLSLSLPICLQASGALCAAVELSLPIQAA